MLTLFRIFTILLLGLSFSVSYAQTSDDPDVLPPFLVAPSGLLSYEGRTIAQAGPSLRSQASSFAYAPTIDAFANRARQQGTINVIIQVESPTFRPEGVLDVAAARAQRGDITATQTRILSALAPYNVGVVARYDTIPYLALEVDEAAVRALATTSGVVAIYEEGKRTLTLSEAMSITNITETNDFGFDGTNQVVAVIDTGVEATHPFFEGRVVAEACFSSTGCANGQFDDYGTGAASPELCSGVSGCLHGTHVAGIVAGENATIRGSAPNSQIVAIYAASVIFDPFTQQLGIIFTDASVLSALEHVYNLKTVNGLNVVSVNLSIGSQNLFTTHSACDSANAAYKTLFDQLLSVGVIPVAASGNKYDSAAISHPGCSASTLAVSATDNFDNVAFFANNNDLVDMLAPGVSITSSGLNGQYTSLSGTSMASPLIAGAVATLRQQNPDLSMQDLISTLRSTGQPVLDRRNSLTQPRLDLYAAVLSEFQEAADTVGAYDFASGGWLLRNFNTAGISSVPAFNYGRQNVPVVGDWNGDGVDTIGVYNTSSGKWYLRSSNTKGSPDIPVFNFGRQNVPVVGDWNGDGVDTIGVYNTSTGRWYLRNSNTVGSPDIPVFAYGRGNVPITGDWNGDGVDTIGVYNTSTGRWYLRNSNTVGSPDVEVFAYGPGNVPVTGDWNNDNIDTIGVYNMVSGIWYLRDSNNAGGVDIPVFSYNPNDIPVVGDWDASNGAVTSLALQPQITSLVLYDVDTGTALTTIESGDVLSLADLPEQIAIVAEAIGGHRVIFDYQGVEAFTVDDTVPYTLTGDTDGVLVPAALAAGEHVLSAALYDENNARLDTLDVIFTVE